MAGIKYRSIHTGVQVDNAVSSFVNTVGDVISKDVHTSEYQALVKNALTDIVNGHFLMMGNNNLVADSGISAAGLEVTSNKVTSVSSESTNDQYPSAKVLYDNYVDKTSEQTITGEKIFNNCAIFKSSDIPANPSYFKVTARDDQDSGHEGLYITEKHYDSESFTDTARIHAYQFYGSSTRSGIVYTDRIVSQNYGADSALINVGGFGGEGQIRFTTSDNSTYGVKFPDTSSYTADKTLATTDDIGHITGTLTIGSTTITEQQLIQLLGLIS